MGLFSIMCPNIFQEVSEKELNTNQSIQGPSSFVCEGGFPFNQIQFYSPFVLCTLCKEYLLILEMQFNQPVSSNMNISNQYPCFLLLLRLSQVPCSSERGTLGFCLQSLRLTEWVLLSQLTLMLLDALHYCLILLTLNTPHGVRRGGVTQPGFDERWQWVARHLPAWRAGIWAATVIASLHLMKYSGSAPYLRCQLVCLCLILPLNCCDWAQRPDPGAVCSAALTPWGPPGHSSCTRWWWSHSQHVLINMQEKDAMWKKPRQISINIHIINSNIVSMRCNKAAHTLNSLGTDKAKWFKDNKGPYQHFPRVGRTLALWDIVSSVLGGVCLCSCDVLCDTSLKEAETKGGREKGKHNSCFIKSAWSQKAITAEHNFTSFLCSGSGAEELLWFDSVSVSDGCCSLHM